MFQENLREFKRCFNDVSRIFISREIKLCFKGVKKKLKGIFKEVSRKFQSSFIMFQNIFKEFLGLLEVNLRMF